MNSSSEILTPDMYYKAIEGSDSGLWVLDLRTKVCYLSNRYYTMLGYEPGEFEGTLENIFGLLHPDDFEKSNEAFNEFFTGRTLVYRNEVRLKNKNGTYNHILTQGLGERDIDGNLCKFIGWNIDITLLKDAQKKLDEQYRLIQMGVLAGGLTHEINNPLTVILGRSELMLKAIKSGKEIDVNQFIANLETIQDASRKIAEIVHGLRTIADGGIDWNKTTVSINEVLENVVELSKKEIEKKKISLHVKLPKQNVSLYANPSLLSQVFLNLINNAIDALDGILEKDIWIELTSKADHAYVFVDDNGVGIDPADETKIMLPFFTTKEPGKGTGLGLSISKSLVQSLSGDIHYEKLEKKSRFVVTLPCL